MVTGTFNWDGWRSKFNSQSWKSLDLMPRADNTPTIPIAPSSDQESFSRCTRYFPFLIQMAMIKLVIRPQVLAPMLCFQWACCFTHWIWLLLISLVIYSSNFCLTHNQIRSPIVLSLYSNWIHVHLMKLMKHAHMNTNIFHSNTQCFSSFSANGILVAPN